MRPENRHGPSRRVVAEKAILGVYDYTHLSYCVPCANGCEKEPEDPCVTLELQAVAPTDPECLSEGEGCEPDEETIACSVKVTYLWLAYPCCRSTGSPGWEDDCSHVKCCGDDTMPSALTLTGHDTATETTIYNDPGAFQTNTSTVTQTQSSQCTGGSEGEETFADFDNFAATCTATGPYQWQEGISSTLMNLDTGWMGCAPCASYYPN